MNIWLEILGVLILVIGLIFCVLPIIPGQALAYGALVLKYFCDKTIDESFSTTMIVLLVAMIVVSILDYVIPSWLVRVGGGSKYGSRGALIGTFVGLIFTPIGMLLGMFLGAFIGEMMVNNHTQKALRVSAMTFVGFLLSTGLKLTYAGVCFWYFF